MRKQVLMLLVLAMGVSACSTVRDSRINPFNWFGRSKSVVINPQETAINPLIPKRNIVLSKKPEAAYSGSLVESITELHIRRVAGGAVIEATGVFTSQGSFDVRLVAEDSADGATLTYSMRAYQPRKTVGLGSTHSRSVTAAVQLTDQELAGIRNIRVVAKNNVRSSRR